MPLASPKRTWRASYPATSGGGSRDRRALEGRTWVRRVRPRESSGRTQSRASPAYKQLPGLRDALDVGREARQGGDGYDRGERAGGRPRWHRGAGRGGSYQAPRAYRGGARVPRGGGVPGGDVPDAHRPGPRHPAHNPPLRRIGSLEPRSSAESVRAMPTDAPFDLPVVAVWRGNLVESVHRGRYVVRDARAETLDSLGDSAGYVHLRSSAKPFQALPLVFSGAADAFGLTSEELAVACASHSAEPRHLAAVRSILRKAGLSEDDLQNGIHAPRHVPTAARLARNGELPRHIHGNCSGKHAGMLAVCVHAGWDPAGYRDPNGPLQKLVRRTVAKLCGMEPEEVRVAGDGCGVPV